MAPSECKTLLSILDAEDLAPPALLLPGCVGVAGYFDGVGFLGDFAMGSTTWVSSYFGSPGSSSMWAGTSLSDADFASDLALRLLGRRSRVVEVPAIAASGFAAAEFMVRAVESADTKAASSVIAALNQLELDTIYGRSISFDSNGWVSLAYTSLQSMTRSFSVTSKEVAFGAWHVYPAPSFAFRQCFHREAGVTAGIGADGLCGECPFFTHLHFRGGAWQHLPAWMCIALRCEAGADLDRHSQCIACPVGTSPDVENRTVDTNGRDDIFVETCTSCPEGTIAERSNGLPSCVQCPPGYEAPNIGSMECIQCTNGTFAPFSGMPQCLPCPSGRVATGSGSTACEECSQGRTAEKVEGRAEVCSHCPEGRYQTQPGQTVCSACPKGTDCVTQGTSRLTNLPGWWVRASPAANCTDIAAASWSMAEQGACENATSEADWFPCTLNGACLVRETCSKGSTGIACGVCLPQYTRIDGKCIQCPEWGSNLFISFIIGLILSAAMLCLTALSILGAGKAKSIISVLLKLALNYSTTMIIMTELQDLVFLQQSKDRQLRDPSLPESSAAGLFRMTGSIVGASLEDLQGSVWSLSCLWHPTLDPEEERTILEYAAARSTAAHLYQEGASKLLDFHELVELRNLIFYATIIPGMILGLLLIVGIVLSIYMYIRRKFLQDVVNYFIRLGTKRIDRAQKGMTAEKVERYHRMADWRFLGIWKAVTIYRSRYSFRGLCSRFIYESTPLFVVIAFVLYPLCLRSLLTPMRCEQPTDDVDGHRMSRSMDIECTWGDSALIVVSLICATGLGISLPFIGSMVIYHVKKQQFHSKHLQRTLNFLTGGYQLDRSWWECVVLVRKTLGMFLAAVQMSIHARLLGMVVLASLFLFLHVRYQPFDNRYNELLDWVETVHLVAWNVFSVALLAIYLLRDDQEAAISILLSGLLAAHFTFLLSLFGALAKHIMTSTALQIALRATERLQGRGMVKRPPLEDLAQAELAAGRRTNGRLLRRYAQIMNRTPYLAASISESGLLWFTIGGNLGGKCPLPKVQKWKFDEVKLPNGVQAPSDRSCQYALSIIFDAFEFILIEQQHLACSASMLEFVFRVAFTFGVDGTFRLPEPDQLPSAAEGYREPSRFGSALHRFNRYVKKGLDMEADDIGDMSRMTSMEEGSGAVVSLLSSPGGTATGSTAGGASGNVTTTASMPGGSAGITQADERSRYTATKSFRNADSEAHKAQNIGRKWAGTRGSTKAIQQTLEKRDETYRKVVQKMYQRECYEQGLTLEELQLNLTAKLGGTSLRDLKDWIDFFEQEWLQRRDEWVEQSKQKVEKAPHGYLQSVSTLRNQGVRDFATQVHHESFLPELLLHDVPRQPDVEFQETDDEDTVDSPLPGIAFAPKEAHVRAPDTPLLPSLSSVWRSETTMSWLRFYLKLLAQEIRWGALDCTRARLCQEIDDCDFIKFAMHQHEESTAKVQEKLHQTETEEAQQEMELGSKIAELRTKLKDIRIARVQQQSAAFRNARSSGSWDTYV
mmetsp:Transcript_12815/g.28911  ORF Transcript_12815/g.28911 Transcript_12815/m.28911 type:complete len:1515 (+) Transcript_12815:1-4545(+)